jgi:hypothetical protein
LIAYELKRPRQVSSKQKPEVKHTLHLPTSQAEALSKKNARKKAIFDKEFTDFWADVGDVVYFKHSKANRIEYRVKAVESDWQKCKWTKGGTLPMFIQLSRTVILAGDKSREETIWTHTGALSAPSKKGEWRT